MAAEQLSRTTQPPPQRVKRPAPLSPQMRAFLTGWFLAWPLLIFVYNPLPRPYEPLTLLLVIPGGAIWLLSCGFGCDALVAMAKARWPATTKTILEILTVVLGLIWITLLCIP